MTSDPQDPLGVDALQHPVDEGGPRGRGSNDIRASWWNLLLLLPLLMLITSIYNKQGPELFGLPFFYWFQFVFVFVGVACVWVVYIKTKHISRRTGGTNK